MSQPSRDVSVNFPVIQKTKSPEKFLQKVDLFKDMQHEKLMRVAEALESEKHLKDEPIILQGEKGHHFYLIDQQ